MFVGLVAKSSFTIVFLDFDSFGQLVGLYRASVWANHEVSHPFTLFIVIAAGRNFEETSNLKFVFF